MFLNSVSTETPHSCGRLSVTFAMPSKAVRRCIACKKAVALRDTFTFWYDSMSVRLCALEFQEFKSKSLNRMGRLSFLWAELSPYFAAKGERKGRGAHICRRSECLLIVDDRIWSAAFRQSVHAPKYMDTLVRLCYEGGTIINPSLGGVEVE